MKIEAGKQYERRDGGITSMRQFQAWRTDVDGTEGVQQPHPRDISEALGWAISELSKGEHDD